MQPVVDCFGTTNENYIAQYESICSYTFINCNTCSANLFFALPNLFLISSNRTFTKQLPTYHPLWPKGTDGQAEVLAGLWYHGDLSQEQIKQAFIYQLHLRFKDKPYEIGYDMNLLVAALSPS